MKQITLRDFYENNGYSAHNFVPHMKYFIDHLTTSLHVHLYRYKAEVVHTTSGAKITLKVHQGGRSERYASAYFKGREVITVRDDVSPPVFFELIKAYLMSKA
jgi:hypothetical protein